MSITGYGFLADEVLPLAIEAFGVAGIRRADTLRVEPSWHRVGIAYLGISWAASTLTRPGALLADVSIDDTTGRWALHWTERVA